MRIGDFKYIFLKKKDYIDFIKQLPNRKLEKLSEELSILDIEILKDL